MERIFAVVGIFVFTVLRAGYPQPYSAHATGTLKDKYNLPVPHTVVEFRNATDTTEVYKVQTDSTGSFYLTLPVGRSFRMYAVYQGARVVFDRVLIIPNVNADIEVTIDLKVILDTLYKKIIPLRNVYFEFDRAELKPESYPALDSLTAYLKANPTMVVEIAGHTDSIGSAEYNLRLSQQRAQAVVGYLVSRGIDPHRLIARGYGESQPVADNGTEEGRALNRRVEMRIIRW